MAQEVDDSSRCDPRFLGLVVRAELVLGALLMLAMASLTVFQIVSRYVLATPYPWTEELARFSMIWLTFIAAAAVMAKGGHIAVTSLGEWLGPRWHAIFYVAAHLVVAGTCAVLILASGSLLEQGFAVRAPASGLFMSYVYAASTVGFLLMGLHALINAALVIRHGNRAIKSDMPEAAK